MQFSNNVNQQAGKTFTGNAPPPSYDDSKFYPTPQYDIKYNQVADVENKFGTQTRGNYGVPLGVSYLTTRAAYLIYINMAGIAACMALVFQVEPTTFRKNNFIISSVRMMSIVSLGELAFFMIYAFLYPKMTCGKSVRYVHMRKCRSVGFVAILLGVSSFALLLHSFGVFLPDFGSDEEETSWYNHSHECDLHEDGCARMKIAAIVGVLSSIGMVGESYLHYIDAKRS